MLYTSGNDIVQKNIETGAVERTLRGHTSRTSHFILTNGSTLISAGWDDLIIVWDLETGSIMKRIRLSAIDALIVEMSYLNNYIFTGGEDKMVRQIDLVTGKVIKTVGKNYGAY